MLTLLLGNENRVELREKVQFAVFVFVFYYVKSVLSLSEVRIMYTTHPTERIFLQYSF